MASPTAVSTSREAVQDLGFGQKLSGEPVRMLNRDGTFNVVREGVPFRRAFHPYQLLVTMTWPRFYAVVVAAYLVVNVAFASAYLACGPGALQGVEALHGPGRFVDCFFFSVQTLATIGYGRINPVGLGANVLVAVEAFVGLLGFAMATALAFTRFSRPQAVIRFSRSAVVAPYRGISAFEFRIVNERRSQLIEVAVEVLYSRMVIAEGRRIRKFDRLALERDRVTFFPLQWVVVHPIDESSPLAGVTEEALRASETEFLILLTGIDETFFQSVHARSSYRWDEVVVGARFADMYRPATDGRVRVDLRRFDAFERV